MSTHNEDSKNGGKPESCKKHSFFTLSFHCMNRTFQARSSAAINGCSSIQINTDLCQLNIWTYMFNIPMLLAPNIIFLQKNEKRGQICVPSTSHIETGNEMAPLENLHLFFNYIPKTPEKCLQTKPKIQSTPTYLQQLAMQKCWSRCMASLAELMSTCRSC